MIKLPVQLSTRFIYFNKNTGRVTNILKTINKKLTDPYIEVNKDEIQTVLDKKVSFTQLLVYFDTDKKKYELKKSKLSVEVYDVNEAIYHLKDIEDADIKLTQDINNTCWKIEIDKDLRNNLIQTQVMLDTLLTFSITQKDNPNILLKMIRVSLKDLVNQGYKILPYTQDFEKNSIPISIYTSRRFKTYSYKVLK